MRSFIALRAGAFISLRFPLWLQLTLGAACAAVGVALVMRPFTSLGVLVAFVSASFVATGLSELVSMDDVAIPALVTGFAWLVAGVLVLAWAGITIHALAIVAGISLVIGGLSSLAAARRTGTEDRLIAGLSGGASVIFGVLAPRYAPDMNVLGVVAIAPASDLKALVSRVKDTLEGKILAAYILTAYSEIYPDVSFDEYVRPAARVIVRATASRCLELPEAIVSAATVLLSGQQKFPEDPLAGALGRRLAENTPTGAIRMPLLIAQGLADPLVLPDVQEQFVKQRCDAGQSLEYLTYEGRDHLSVLAPDLPLIPDLLAWTEARFSSPPRRRRLRHRLSRARTCRTLQGGRSGNRS